jgi:hypothetical protein
MLPYIAYMDPMGNVSYQLSSKSVTLCMKKKAPTLRYVFTVCEVEAMASSMIYPLVI